MPGHYEKTLLDHLLYILLKPLSIAFFAHVIETKEGI